MGGDESRRFGCQSSTISRFQLGQRCPVRAVWREATFREFARRPVLTAPPGFGENGLEPVKNNPFALFSFPVEIVAGAGHPLGQNSAGSHKARSGVFDQRLHGHRDGVLDPALHLWTRNAPTSRVSVNLGPFGVA